MKIVTLGCSFTEKYPGVDKVWPEIVADSLEAKLVNYGRSGSGNAYAYSSLVTHILTHGAPDRVYWLLTEYDRMDLHWNKKSLMSIDYENEPSFLDHFEKMISSHKDHHLTKTLTEQVKKETKISKILTKRPTKYIIDSNFIIIHQVQEICKAYNIKLTIMQGLTPLNYDLNHYDVSKFSKLIISSEYFSLIDKSNIIGYPFMKLLGGFNIMDRLGWYHWHSNYAISKVDPHPSQVGHNYIADFFLGNISTLP